MKHFGSFGLWTRPPMIKRINGLILIDEGKFTKWKWIERVAMEKEYLKTDIDLKITDR